MTSECSNRPAGTTGVSVPLVCALVLAIGNAASALSPAPAAPLRICSDPNNLPFSNRHNQGFENAIGNELAAFLGTRVEYAWWAQRRGFVRNTLNAGRCDVVMGYPEGAEGVLTTIPYYRSTYVFVTRRAQHLHIRSFDDPALRRLRIAVPLVGDDGASTPPAYSLSRRGIVTNLVGYSVYGDYATANPPAAMVAAVARGDVDVAAAWGPLAGYFAAQSTIPLDIVPVFPTREGPVSQTFAISMAVRKSDAARQRVLDRFIRERQATIDAILARYRVPRVPS